MKLYIPLLLIVIIYSCNSNDKNGNIKITETIEIDTIKLDWNQRPKLDLKITDGQGNIKDISKGDTLIVTVSMTNKIKAFQTNSKIIVDQKMNNNCKTEQINDSTFKLLVSEKPKGSLLTFELMLYKPKTVFQLPNNGVSEKIKNIYFNDSLGISAFAFEIK